MKQRLYANTDKSYIIQNGDDIKAYVSTLSDNRKNFTKDQYEQYYKLLCDKIRNSINTDCLIGIVTNDLKEVVVILYDVKSTADNHYHHYYDKKKNWFYIEIENNQITA